ncbi:transcriptional regulator of acetoin/glycerol metabolism [Microbacterium terrae]|uniref:Acetoin dehydrogenase operon transcriptional activator AcoR n=1 Tax=Microbacterium terrae TaxID=69369 RepID=A0A0M2GXE0_9MICO|nr:GAF domain-containing protein [Microbacterium terrae]KJL38414.1 Acetoin dehydrogenase operon transcriptional activator AcoR [Microbacterium terrae]MBP1078944.1 transcriptional regulator of acetoin/glycerol metabolism [Microbacterium terrae]GLJ98344.1 transcriptional regulator [Microbacterium terrae]
MTSSWSQRRDVSPENARLLIERAHDELLAGNAADERLGDVRALVRDSWRRSLASLVGADALPPLDLDLEALAAYRREHPLAVAIDMVRGLLLPGGADESGVVVAVGDASGRLLWVEGDRTVRTLTGDVGFIEGTNWSETAVGTSAPGTALTLDHSVQIHGAEHFNRLVQPWSCTAAPVHDPETRRVLGVIDVTGGVEAVTPQAQLLVDATARAIEGELLVARLRERAQAASSGLPRRPQRRVEATHATLRVLGRNKAVLEVIGDGIETVSELGPRHAELLLMLAVHRQGLSAERLGELVYGEPDASVTLRAEMVRLRKVLERTAPALVPQSRPYRLGVQLDTDAHQLLSLLGRGAHRVALAAYRGDVLPDSVAPGVEEFRDTVRTALREALLAEASVDVLLAYADTDAGADDVEVLRLCLSMLPARSPRRAGLVARIEKLEA